MDENYVISTISDSENCFGAIIRNIFGESTSYAQDFSLEALKAWSEKLGKFFLFII